MLNIALLSRWHPHATGIQQIMLAHILLDGEQFHGTRCSQYVDDRLTIFHTNLRCSGIGVL